MPRLATLLCSLGAAFAAAPAAFQLPSRPPRDVTRNSAALVALDVSVRDQKTGEPIRNLKRSEFEVTVGGVRQALASATFTTQRIVVFFVDDLHLDFNNTARLRDLLRRVAAELARDGDLVAFASDGPSQIPGAMSADPAATAEAIQRVAGYGLRPKEIRSDLARGGPSEVLYRAHVALTAACEQIERRQEYRGRRKTLVFVSNGFDVGPLTAARDPITVSTRPASPDRNFSVGADFAALVAAARRTSVILHTLDAGSMIGNEGSPDPSFSQTEWERFRTARQATLAELSGATGGLTVTSAGDLEAALKQIADATADYYLVEFYPANGRVPAIDAIEVSVTRRGAIVTR